MINHNPFLNNPYLQALQQNQQMMAERNSQSQGTVFTPVHSDNEVLNSPVAPGNTIYFKHETEPYIYTKSMGMSQFEVPQTKKYKLEEVEMTNGAINVPTEPISQPKQAQPKYLLEDDIKPILDELRQCKEELKDLRARLEKEVVEPITKPTKANTSTPAKEK